MTEYFASLPDDQLAKECQKRVDDYYEWILNTDRLSRWRIAYDTYYGQRGSHNSSYVSAGGDNDELSFLMSNEYRNLVQHLLVLTMQSRPSIEIVATNTDSKSKAQAYLAEGIVEYYRRSGKIDENCYLATEISLIMDSAWVFNEWDLMRGQDVAVDDSTGSPVKQGDIYSRARTPLDVIIDFTKLDGTDRDWIIVRDPKNKFDLAAQYPEKADKILSVTRDKQKDAIFRFGDMANDQSADNTSDIDVYTLYHRRSPALPQGKMFQWISGDLSLFSGPIPYRKLPGNRIAPSEQILSPLGYSNANDLLGLQDVMDSLISYAVSSMNMSAANCIWTPPGSNIDVDQLADGLKQIESDVKPEVLIMNKLPPEWFNLANFIIGRMEAISGVNSVARGNTQGKDMSGAAMALLQSMSIQFNSGLQRSNNKLVEDCANDVVQLTQDFAHEKRLGMIVGLNNQYMMKEYGAKDVEDVQRVFCRQSNPMKDTTAGKMELLKVYQAIPGAVTNPAQVTEILDTGSLKSFSDPARNKKLTIDQENEALMRGEQVPVVFCDQHLAHLDGHSAIFSGPEARRDPNLITAVRAHVDEHLQVWQTTDMAILMAFNIPPFPQPMMMPMPGPNGEPPPPPPPGPGGPMPGAMPSEPNQPNMPTNPLTGEPAPGPQ